MTAALDQRTEDVIVPELEDVADLHRAAADAVDAGNGQLELLAPKCDRLVHFQGDLSIGGQVGVQGDVRGEEDLAGGADDERQRFNVQLLEGH